MSPPRHISSSTTTNYYRSTGQHVVKALRIILYYRSTCPHLAIYFILYYYLPQVYRSTRRQNPQRHTITTGPHVPTSPYISFSTTTYHRFTGQHVVKTPRINPLLQVNMSPPRHISHSLLLPTTGLQVNTSSNPSEAYYYYRSPCPYLTMYLILNYYLLQVYRSTRRQAPQKHTSTTGHHVTTSPCISFSTTTTYHRSTHRQNPHKHTITTGQHVPTSPYISFSTTTYYRSTGQHVVKTLRINPLLQVTMSPPRHISYSLLLPTTGLQVNTSTSPSEAHQYYRSPCHHLTMYLILYYYLPQVYTSSKPSQTYHYYRSPCHHLTIYPYLFYYLLQVNMSSKHSEAYQYYMSPCHHLTMYFILYYHLLLVHRSTRLQNPQKHTITTGHHVTTSPYIPLSTTRHHLIICSANWHTLPQSERMNQLININEVMKK